MRLKLFISRPILAIVISVVIVLCGIVAMFNMPLSQFPDVAPPTIYVSASLPGANAETIERTVAAQLEAQLNGASGLLYMNSSSTSNGYTTVVLTFEVGTNLDFAINDVLNRVHAATPLLPAPTQKLGINVAKVSPNFLSLIYFYNDGTGKFDNYYMGNYLNRTLVNDIKLLNGVGKVEFHANMYAVRIWMNINTMNLLNITPTDIANAIKEQNNEYIIGKSGGMPAESSLLTFNVAGYSMLNTVKEFENIVVRVKNTQVIKLKDVARVELGRKDYGVTPYASFLHSGKAIHNEIALMQIMLTPSANQIEVRNKVMATLKNVSQNFPKGLQYKVLFDGTQFVGAAIDNVEKSLMEALVLVALVIFLFLQNVKASLIALFTVPISIISSFAVLYMIGFSINTLNLFAMILAIGIVVDDAIIVIENIERIKEKSGNINIRSIIEIALEEIISAVIAIALVLSVVFLPVMLLPGLPGVFYRQFAVTIACSVVISAMIALITIPAVSALLLKGKISKNKPLAKFYQWFDYIAGYYLAIAEKLINCGKWVVLLLILSIILVFLIFKFIPASFIPNEDQGFIVGSVNLPSGTSLAETKIVANKVASDVLAQKGVDQVVEVVGVDFFGGGVNSYAATIFVTLKNWSMRSAKNEGVEQVVAFVNSLNVKYKNVSIRAFGLPPIPGLGSTGGTEFYFEGRIVSDIKQLDAKAKLLEQSLLKHKEIQSVYHMLDTSSEQIRIDPDISRVKFYGVNVLDVYNTLNYIYSSYYVNFAYLMQGLVWVILQGEYKWRKSVKDISNMYVKNNKQLLVPLRSLVKDKRYNDPLTVERFNNYPATQIIVTPNQGYNSGEIMKIIETEMQNTARGYDYEWVGSSYMQTQSQKASIIAFIFAFAMIYLVLCALYEMWSLPLVVLMVVPFALLGSGVMLLIRHQPNDLYFQISLVALLGLSAKNIILLVEFALQEMQLGKSAKEAVLHALKIRFRPIVMTSVTFIVGALPLVFATGAGANAEHSVGTGIIGGMLGSVILGILVAPSYFVLIMKNHAKHSID